MSEGSIPVDLIVIIGIAVFVLFKYRQILGHKTGHDVETPKEKLHQRREKAEERVVQLKQYQKAGDLIELEAEDLTDNALDNLKDDGARKTIESMKKLDGSFTLDGFLSGAKGAFEMLMEAFNNADKPTLKMLLSNELYDEFDQEIKQFEKKEQTPHTTLVSILSAEVAEADLTKSQAQLTIRFISEQIHVVKDKAGKVIEGDVSRIERVEDEWVFERDLKSRNPNWTITDM